MNDLLIIIGQKEVELAILRQQVALLTDQVRALTPAPPPVGEAPAK